MSGKNVSGQGVAEGQQMEYQEDVKKPEEQGPKVEAAPDEPTGRKKRQLTDKQRAALEAGRQKRNTAKSVKALASDPIDPTAGKIDLPQMEKEKTIEKKSTLDHVDPQVIKEMQRKLEDFDKFKMKMKVKKQIKKAVREQLGKEVYPGEPFVPTPANMPLRSHEEQDQFLRDGKVPTEYDERVEEQGYEDHYNDQQHNTLMRCFF